MTRFRQLPLAVAVLILAPVASGAKDICSLGDADRGTTLKKGAAEISQAYAKTGNQLSLKGNACNWECGSGSVVAPMTKAFGFLQYNCATTTLPESERRPTGGGTKSQMGLSITDADYRDAADAIFRSGSSGVGDLMRVPQSLVDAAKSGKVKELIAAVDAISGAQWLKFSSTSVDNDGEGAARILIRVVDDKPDPRFEQWIQIAIKDSTGGLGRNVDFIARQLVADSASSTNPGQVVFRGYSRTASGFVPEGGSSRFQLSKCYSCHPSGLRPVLPAPAGTTAVGGAKAIKPEGTMLVGSDLAAQLEHVKDLTKHLTVFGPAGYDAAQNGPLFGPSGPSGRDGFVAAGCGKGLKKDRRDAIVAQMSCESCHDESDRGRLVAGTSLATIFHKVVTNKVAPMPPGVTDPGGLSAFERKVLFNCLKAEYAKLLREWLIADLPPASAPDASDASLDETSDTTSDETSDPTSDETSDETSGATSDESSGATSDEPLGPPSDEPSDASSDPTSDEHSDPTVVDH